MASSSNDPTVGQVTRWAFAVIAGLAVVILVLVAGFGAYHRWSAVQTANNDAHVARIKAANQAQVNQLLIAASDQQILIHQKQAEIRLADAVGVRKAQDEISKTLTPLYVQFEMVDALKTVAESGKNNTIVYIPTGANGIPLIANTNPNQVTAP